MAHHRDAVRFGAKSRYWSPSAPEFDGIVNRTRRIGGSWFGIVATPERARTLGRVRENAWESWPPATAAPADPPREIWLRSESGERYQAFELGPAGLSGGLPVRGVESSGARVGHHGGLLVDLRRRHPAGAHFEAAMAAVEAFLAGLPPPARKPGGGRDTRAGPGAG